MTAFVGQPTESVIRLMTDTGYGTYAPALNLIYTDVTVRMRKPYGDCETRPLSVEEWQELEDGYYIVKWTPGDMAAPGLFFFKVWCFGCSDWAVSSFDIVPQPFYLDVEAPICVVTGNIVDIGGSPLAIETIVFRPLYVPVVAGPSIVAAGIIRTSTDAFGNFSVKLLRGMQILVEIDRAGIRYQILVPDLPTAPILDLLPPIPA